MTTETRKDVRRFFSFFEIQNREIQVEICCSPKRVKEENVEKTSKAGEKRQQNFTKNQRHLKDNQFKVNRLLASRSLCLLLSFVFSSSCLPKIKCTTKCKSTQKNINLNIENNFQLQNIFLSSSLVESFSFYF